MKRIVSRTGFERKQRGFYGFRKTFRTIADEAGDGVAASYIMGHVACSDDMASIYRQRIDDQRLLDVAEYVRRWLFPEDAISQFEKYRDAAEQIRLAWVNADQVTAEHVQSAILLLGMSQLDLARGIGQTQSHVNSLIRGRRKITEETTAQLQHLISRLADGKAPKPLGEGQWRPTFDSPADVPLSDRAITALSQYPFTAAHLRVLVGCLKENGVMQLTLAKWWGFHPKAIQNFFCGHRTISFRAAEKLRELFNVPRVQQADEPKVNPRVPGMIPATAKVRELFAVSPFRNEQLKALLDIPCGRV